MNTILYQVQPNIAQLCKKHGVRQLYAFGSVLTPRFTDESDVDLLVDFDKEGITDYFTNYFDLKYALEALLGREVDLVEDGAIRSPIFRRNVDRTKSMIYG
ncbi:MAG: nucleotidyltransferase domain-containing protein [Bacteroidaceae bacterium]|nr:nucleotidyltransferase domain-containing protein [Bacteroidaceae bacterium]